MRLKVCTVVLPLVAFLVAERPLPAQDAAAASHGAPRFFVAAGGDAAPVRTDPSRVSALRARVSIDLDNVTLESALDAISAESGTRIAYSRPRVPLDTRVSLSARSISIAAALTEVLLDTGVDVLVSRTGHVTLTRRAPDPIPREPGTIVGRVTEVDTDTPVANAQITVDGAGRAATDDDGRYRIANVPPGRRTVSVTSIGYARASQEVEVTDGATVTVDFVLEVAATQLDEVVVTVTGEQRMRELGHVVGRINADSVVREAPVSTLSELLTARVPGLMVQNLSGQLGGTVDLQLRSSSSIDLSTAPLVVVDGMRYRASTTSGNGPFSNVVEASSRINDLNINDIESIDVVKGPSAAALYGTDAANGVIVITTKRGEPGRPQWNAYARVGYTEPARQEYPDPYWGWGTRPDGSAYVNTLGDPLNCTLALVAAGTCVQDSVAVFPNPLNDPDLTVFASKPRWESGVNVSGGAEAFTYYLSADIESATGPVEMPPAIVRELLDRRGVAALPAEQLEPNKVEKTNLRSTVAANLGQTAMVRLNLGYSRNSTRAGSGVPHVAAAHAGPNGPYAQATGPPNETFARMSTEQIERFSGSVTGEWRPIGWLQARATVGIDQANTTRTSLALPGEVPSVLRIADGAVGSDRGQYRNTTADVGVTARSRFRSISFRSSGGVQYTRTLDDLLTAHGYGLPPGGTTIAMASTSTTSQRYDERVVIGGYIEQVVGLNERLFLSAALRMDGGSGFGQDFKTATYPKAGLSWLLSEEPVFPRVPGIDEFRLRYAFGAAGQQAEAAWTRPLLSNRPGIVVGGEAGGIRYSGLGNPDLRPEQVTEHEVGFELSALGARAMLDLTWDWRRTVDGILTTPVADGSIGHITTMRTNVGLITGRGFEARAHVRLLDWQQLSLDLGLTHAFHTDKLVDLGDANPNPRISGGYMEGYPIGSLFSRRILGYEDKNGDGIIDANEVELTDDMEYIGRGSPPTTQTYSAQLGVFGDRLRVTALLDRQTGFLVNRRPCLSQCRGAVDINTPPDEQAVLAGPGSGSTRAVLKPGDFTRFREVSASWELPDIVVRALRIDRASVNAAVRNLALWTDHSGDDPESYTSTVSSGIPQPRTWTFRFDVGF